jgi:sn-glycerol 3-phosphate transport system ATP-binding protein
MISIKNLKKTYPNGFTVMENFNLDIREGSFTALVGPSGCGKTSLIRLISGLESCTEGEIWISGRNVTGRAPGERGIAMVFQNYALYPHMTVEGNITFGLKNYGYKRSEIDRILAEVLELVGLTEYAKTKPAKLSGGQKQRVGLARAISKNPSVFLMDEPLSNLDANLRKQMQREIIRLHQKLGATFVYITHDQREAMTMGEYITVMNGGAVMQYGTPEEIYGNPANVFTAKFIGDPGMNILEMDDGTFLGFRPQKARITAGPEAHEAYKDSLALKATVSAGKNLGYIYQYTAVTAGGKELEALGGERFGEGAEVNILIGRDDLYFFDGSGNRAAGPGPTEGMYEAL